MGFVPGLKAFTAAASVIAGRVGWLAVGLIESLGADIGELTGGVFDPTIKIFCLLGIDLVLVLRPIYWGEGF
jgi:hypothetical protein